MQPADLRRSVSKSPFRPFKLRLTDDREIVWALRSARKAGQVRYWRYGQAEKSPELAISDLSRSASVPLRFSMSSAIGHASRAVGEPCLHHQPERFSVIAGWCALLFLDQWTRPVSPTAR